MPSQMGINNIEVTPTTTTQNKTQDQHQEQSEKYVIGRATSDPPHRTSNIAKSQPQQPKTQGVMDTIKSLFKI